MHEASREVSTPLRAFHIACVTRSPPVQIPIPGYPHFPGRPSSLDVMLVHDHGLTVDKLPGFEKEQRIAALERASCTLAVWPCSMQVNETELPGDV